MAVTALPIYPQTIKNSVATCTNADGTIGVNVINGAVEGTRLESWLITSTDSVDRTLQLISVVAGNPILVTTVIIPANAGNTNAIPPVDILRSAQLPGISRDSNGIPYLYIIQSTALRISPTVAITVGAKIVSIIQAKEY